MKIKNSIQSVVLLGLSLVFLTNCSSMNRSHLGAGLGGTTTTAVCVESGVTDPYAIAGCAVVGAFAGAERSAHWNGSWNIRQAEEKKR